MMKFTKMHGLGNDFIVIDAINQTVALLPEQIKRLADRHYGIGCDQILVVSDARQSHVDFNYRIFNADGSEVEQCGNGARCFARFVRDKGLTDKDLITVETLSGVISLQLEPGGLVTVDMGMPRFNPADVPFAASQEKPVYDLDVRGQLLNLAVLSMGNPHAVLNVDNVMTADVSGLGAAIESHEAFPERVNVGFMECVDRNHIRLRVYERGAGETLACGTGACAAVVAGRRQGLLDERVSVELAGGNLLVQWSGEGASVMMTGPAMSVFEGEVEI